MWWRRAPFRPWRGTALYQLRRLHADLPGRLSPGFLSRYAEFALHERNRAEHIECCLECGLCGYVCIARRPVLQYIRLSKHKLAQADAAAKLQELRPVTPPFSDGAAAKQGGE